MKRWMLLLACASVAVACQDRLAPTEPGLSPEGAVRSVALDPALQAALTGADADEPLEVIVTFDRAVTTGDALQSSILDLEAGTLGFKHLPMVAALATASQIEAIQALPGVQGIYLSTVEEFHNREAVQSVRADRVHALTVDGRPITGEGVGVAILDTGIDGAHPDVAFGEKTVQNVHTLAHTKDVYELPGRDSITGLKTPKVLKKGYDIWVEDVINSDLSGSGHGTHVASTAAGSGAVNGEYAGVAPRAHLVGINASTAAGLPTLFILSGFDYIIEHRKDYNIQVVNNSWGSSGTYNENEPIPVATREVRDAGITVVFSSGNSGPGQNTMNRRSVAPWVISVAAGCKLNADDIFVTGWCKDDPATSRNEDDGRDHILAWFSSRGIPGDPIQHPDIIAPGVKIASARATDGAGVTVNEAAWRNTLNCNVSEVDTPFYACISGTSMSAPVVTGVIALMEQATGGKITPDQTLEILTKTAVKYPGYGEWEIGAGYVDAEAAVREAMRRHR